VSFPVITLSFALSSFSPVLCPLMRSLDCASGNEHTSALWFRMISTSSVSRGPGVSALRFPVT